MAMKTHSDMVREWMQDPAFTCEYDALEQEFTLFDELLRARKEKAEDTEDVMLWAGLYEMPQDDERKLQDLV